MPVKMSAFQLAFWRELLAPFRSDQLSVTKRGGKELTYVDKRSIENRLDSVCGPHGWCPEYEATSRGYKCRLSILVPVMRKLVPGDPEAETWEWMAKEDGAGFEEMGAKNKETGEFEYDVDNDEKSGYTNALRRAAQDAWGIGRYLYGKGIPTFLDPNALPDGGTLPSPERSAEATRKLHEQNTPKPNPPSTRDLPKTHPASAPDPAPATAPKYDNFKIPKPGKSVFAWAKEMEHTFQTEIVNGMGREGEKQGWSSKFGDWNQTQVNTICLGVISYLREMPTYGGQYEYLFPGGCPDPKIPTASGSGPNIPGPTPGINIADLRKDLITKMKALATMQSGGTPADNATLKRMFGVVAANAANAQGNTGEVPDGLGGVTDTVWISNMIAIVDEEIVTANKAVAGADDIPF